jgi:hypothetical protein
VDDDSAHESITTDDDPSLLTGLTPSMWARYEDAIREILGKRAPDYIRFDGTHLRGALSEIDRQIDVLLTADLLDGVDAAIVVECKFYKRRVGVGAVDELVGKLMDVGAGHGLLCAPNGFTDAARKRAENARNPRVALYDLSGDEELDVEAFLGPDCPSLFCEWGFVHWGIGASAGGETIDLGRCGKCGSMAVRCRTCGYSIGADGVDECGCGYRFTEQQWHDGSEWVVRTPAADHVDCDEAERFDWVPVEHLSHELDFDE